MKTVWKRALMLFLALILCICTVHTAAQADTKTYMKVGQEDIFYGNPGGFVGTYTQNVWTSSNPSVVSVTPTGTYCGVVKCLREGTATVNAYITCTAQGTIPFQWEIVVTKDGNPPPKPTATPIPTPKPTVTPKPTPTPTPVPTPTPTYTVSYHANGGSGAPASQTKTKGKALYLSWTKPTHADSSAGSYTVTLDANGGSVPGRDIRRTPA